MYLAIVVYLFMLGAVFGSFAGAMVWRIKTKRKLANDRSECEHCHHKLSSLDLIPVASWLYLKGKCRYCRKPIGWSPIVIELLLGSVFILSFVAWPYTLSEPLSVLLLASWLIMCVMLTILFVYDLRWFLLPDKVMWPLIAVAGVFFIIKALLIGWGFPQAALELFLGLIPVAGVYYLLYVISDGKWIGFGDVKLGLFMGLVLGWQGALIALMLANFIGLAAILPGLASGKISRTSHIPFGPFLIIATLGSLLWGNYLIDLII